MSRQALEKSQILVYPGAIFCGLITGAAFPGSGAIVEPLLWPVLALLLYATFTRVPLSHLREAFADSRFLAAAVVGNFAALPLVVWGLMALAPADPAIRLGLAMVLLVPCTDWFITFTQMGGGDMKRAIAFSPISLLLQILLLPAYLWLFFAEDFAITLARGQTLAAFGGLILTPLFAAFFTEKWIETRQGRSSLLERLAWLPVPLLAVVVFIIAVSQVNTVMGSGPLLARLFLVFAAFLVIAGVAARLLARLFGLAPAQGRVLAFSFGTRNSFVVLPIALALPPSFEQTAVVIVFQSLVELFGMIVYLWWVPGRLFPVPP